MSEARNSYGEIVDTIRWDERGLVPAIVQDVQSKEVLMLAYMNRESLQLTLESGKTWFYSRSRNELWNKGATSGHFQTVSELAYDCDADTILVRVEQQGPACHTGKYSCFYQTVVERTAPAATEEQYGATYFRSHGRGRVGAGAGESESGEQVTEARGTYRVIGRHESTDRYAILSLLEQTIATRDAERPEGAYTTALFASGLDKILKKIGEEAAEVIIAAKNRDAHELRYEVSDLLFHLMVLLREQRLPLDDVLQELTARYTPRKQA